jgi:tetratricopeptide (TPR) repeat protein
VIAAAFAVRTWVRNIDWQDARAMAEATVRTSPNSYNAHKMLATVLYANGAPGSNLDRAVAEVDRAVTILDTLPDSRNNLVVYRLAGRLYLAKGDSLHERGSSESFHAYQRALQLLQRSIAIDKSGRAEYDRKGGAEWARRHSTVAVGARGDPEARWMLAVTYLRLGQAEEASAAASDALALHPANPEAYRQISSIFAAQGRIEDAAVALMEGGLITSDLSFRSDLLDLYRSVHSNSCAITAGPNGPALNPACDLVHKPLCTASVEAVKAAVEARLWDVARQQKQNFVNKYGCPAGPLDQALTEGESAGVHRPLQPN